MKIFEANISHRVADLLNQILGHYQFYESANDALRDSFGFSSFFDNQQDYEVFKDAISLPQLDLEEPDRTEYGDFQTNQILANAVTNYLKYQKNLSPQFVIEPTCGKGSFIVAALSSFDQIETLIGVEIYKPYIWEAKFNIIDFYISNPTINKPKIDIFHSNVFEFDFSSLVSQAKGEILVLGNPPWVTNSKLSSLESNNLPKKSNFKKHSGFDAISGKGNFDIGESVILMMYDAFQNLNGNLAVLLKNSVIKNLVFDQPRKKYKISNLNKLTINSKKEFNVAVESSLLFSTLNTKPESTCKEFDFYHPQIMLREFGWVGTKYVSNIKLYQNSFGFDGVCPLEWRQGIKHDLSAIMELERVNDYFLNGNKEIILLEDDLIFGLLKSSDLKHTVIKQPRKFTIITQKKVGQDTSFIQSRYPKTFEYLHANKTYFDKRKSSIYKNKPNFSIFGIGDYSFLPYKVAISGLYKTFNFSLILPMNDKPLMLDDTCYLLGFDIVEFAAYTIILLNSNKTRELLKSITFSDAKRMFTKDILMRIDLYSLANHYSLFSLKEELNRLHVNYNLSVSLDKWDCYLKFLKSMQVAKQGDIFALTDE